LADAGYTARAIAESLGVSKGAVAYHLRRLGRPPDERFARRYDWAEVQRVYDSGSSVRECAALFGFSHAAWHQAVQRGLIVPRPAAIAIEDLLVAGRPGTNRAYVKRRLLAAGLKDNVCEGCGIREWLGGPLCMQLHHRNGDGGDYRLENLQFLCPNRHSLTENWGGRNKGRRS
jgi:hypothetical protein